MKLTYILAACAIGLAFWRCQSAHGQYFVALNHNGVVYTIDPQTGTGELLNGNTGFTGYNSSASIPGSRHMFTSSVRRLIDISEDTGEASLIGMMNIDDIRGMAYDVTTGKLYGFNDGGTTNDFDILYEIDPATAQATLIGTSNRKGIQGFAIDSAGRAFAWDLAAGLVQVDLSSGLTTDVGETGGYIGIQCLAFDDDDNLWGSRDSLFMINKDDGSYSVVGSGGYGDVRGMEFYIHPVYTLTLNGDCANQGSIDVMWSGAIPNETQALIFGRHGGHLRVPMGRPCAGTQLYLGGIVRYVDTLPTGDGTGVATYPIGPGACGGSLQLLQLADCEVSNRAEIP